MPSWDLRHAPELRVHPPGVFHIRLVLVPLSVAAFLVTLLSARRGPQSSWAYLTFGFIVAMLTNVFVPHLPAAIRFRGYAPGVITAVAIKLPLMTFLAVRSVGDGWVSGWKAAAFGAGIPLTLSSGIAVWLAR